MRDFHISVKRQKAEIKWFIACFCAAFLLNVISIIIYETSWSELFTQILWIMAIACGIYAISAFFRILFYLVKRLL